MIKVKNGIATREAVPYFLLGLLPESLADLSWTDPSLGVSDCAWWPEIVELPALGRFEKYGDEYFEIDADAKTVTVRRHVVDMSEEEKADTYNQIKASIIASTQERLDTWAGSRNYDGILSLCTYATSAVSKFAAEGQAGVNARDATWAKLYQILDDVKQGLRPVPSGYDEIEPELPVLTWPND